MLFVKFILFSLCPLALARKRTLISSQHQYIKTTNVVCDSSPDWIENVTCRLKPINWEKTLTNVAFDIKTPLRNVSIHVQVYRLETRYVPYLINVTKNLCEIFAHKGMNFYTRILMQMVKRFSNRPHPSCPLTGHFEGNNIYMDASFIGFLIPTGKFKMECFIYEGYPPQYVGFVTAFGTVGYRYK